MSIPAAICGTGGEPQRSDTLICLFCQARIHFIGLPATRYNEHLFKEHNILFGIDAVIQKTLEEQIPGYKKGETEPPEAQPLMVDAFCQTEMVVLPKLNLWSSTKQLCCDTIPAQTEARTSKIKVPWFSGCEYECQICGQMYYYVQELRTHIKKEHECPNEYLEKFKQFETRSVFFPCKICKKKIKRNFAAVCGHLKDEHPNEDILSYQVRFGLGEYQISRCIAGNKFKEDEKGGGNDDEESTQKRGLKRARQETPEKESQKHSKKWFEGCEYQCQICSDMFFEKDSLLLHVRNHHDMTERSYQQKYHKFQTSSSMFQCQVCKCDIKHHKSSIETHIKNEHGIETLKGYENRFLTSEAKGNDVRKEGSDEESQTFSNFFEFRKGYCLFGCKLCAYQTENSINFWSHAKKKHQVDIKGYKSNHGDPCLQKQKIECAICFKMLRHECGSLMSHAKFHKLTVKQFYEKHYKRRKKFPKWSDTEVEMVRWANQCRFDCRICNKMFQTHESFTAHIKAEHQLSTNSYRARFNSLMTSKKFYQCKICHKELVHTHANLRLHTARHKVPLIEYYEQYVLKKKKETIANASKKISDPLGNVNTQADALSIWANAMTFTCNLCQLQYKTLSAAKNHIIVNHCGRKKFKYMKLDNPVTVDKKVHSCKLCQKQVPWQKELLSRHFQNWHGMTITEYYNTHIVEETRGENEPLEDSSLSKSTNHDGRRTKKKRSLNHQRAAAKRWAHSGKGYKCKKCGRHCSYCHNIIRHLKNLHNITTSPTEHYQYLSEKLKCKICEQTINWTPAKLSMHLKTHNLSLVEYFVEYISSSGKEPSDQAEQNEETQKISKQHTPSPVNQDTDFFSDTSEESNVYKDAENAIIDVERLSDSFTDTKWNANIQPLQKDSATGELSVEELEEEQEKQPEKILSNEVVSSETTNEFTQGFASRWTDGCIYCCALCSGHFFSKISIKAHVAIHGFEYQGYVDTHGDPTTVTNLFKCRICCGVMKHDREDIQSHLLLEHDASLDQYYNEHVKNATEQEQDGVDVNVRQDFLSVIKEEMNEVSPGTNPPDAFIKVGEEMSSNINQTESTRSFDKCMFDWNQCSGLCPYCNMSFSYRSSLSLIQEHQQLFHPGTIIERKDLRPSNFSHQCKMCQSRIKFQRLNITNHLKIHGMRLSEYETRFKDEIDHEIRLLNAFKQSTLGQYPGELEGLPIVTDVRSVGLQAEQVDVKPEVVIDDI